MKAELEFKSASPQDTAKRCLAILTRELQRARPSSLEASGDAIIVRGGLLRLVGSWNLLAPITSATFFAEPIEGGVRIRYRASLIELVVACLCFDLIFGIAVAAVERTILARIGIAVVPSAWMFGGNYLIARVRLSRLLARVAKEGDETMPASLEAADV